MTVQVHDSSSLSNSLGAARGGYPIISGCLLHHFFLPQYDLIASGLMKVQNLQQIFQVAIFPGRRHYRHVPTQQTTILLSLILPRPGSQARSAPWSAWAGQGRGNG